MSRKKLSFDLGKALDEISKEVLTVSTVSLNDYSYERPANEIKQIPLKEELQTIEVVSETPETLEEKIKKELISVAEMILIVEDIENIKERLYQKRDALKTFIESGYFQVEIPHKYRDVYGLVKKAEKVVSKTSDSKTTKTEEVQVDVSIKPPLIMGADDLIDGFNVINDEDYIRGRKFAE